MRRLLGRILFSLLIFALVWLFGLAWFIAQVPRASLSDDTPVDAIIVLTGGGGRLEYGLELLAQGKGKKLFISGVHGPSMEDVLKLAPADTRPQLLNAQQSIVLGHRAENTIGNAEEAARWLHAHHYHSLRLVTSSYHMPRALSEFRWQLPEMIILSEPVFTEDFNAANWWKTPENRELVLSEYHKYLASKLRHLIVSATHKP